MLKEQVRRFKQQKDTLRKLSIFGIFIASLLAFSTIAQRAYSKNGETFYRQLGFLTTSKTTNKPRLDNTELPIIKVSLEKIVITPTPTSIPTPTPTESPKVIENNDDDVWRKLAECESHQNWSIDTGNGYYGGLQFTLGAWASAGGSGKPSDASSEEQITRGKILQSSRGWGAWGECSRKIGL